ncbi:MAG: DUF3426 domain-containing protein [Sideroxydans sp.]|jgi:predicted Zn finger-like uncharacterized protein
MNIAVTQCPACATRFNVSEAQLEARDGLVRCGRCETVFNAREHLLPDEPSPQLNLPIGDEAPLTDSLPGGQDDRTQSEHFIPPDFADLPTETTEQPDLAPLTDVAGLEETPSTLAQQVQIHDTELDEEVPLASIRSRRLPFFLGFLLLILLLAQTVYFFRNELALRLPGLKPRLQQVCEVLSCSIDLPHDADLLSIESSELEADSKHPNVFVLHVLLRNHADHAQALPSLELTLTDTQEQVIARRTFYPADYLKGLAEKPNAMAAKRELTLALHLETAELRPTGYRLLLFYPPQP